MYLSRYYSRRTSNLARMLMRWRRGVRSYWWRANKESWAFVLVLALIVTLFGFALRGVFAYQDESRDLARQEERRNLTCLAWNVYFEARGESLAGQHAVAEVTMNRRASGRFADTICGVVYQQNWDFIRKRYVGAFSWTELKTVPMPAGEEWERAWQVAEAVYYTREPPKLHGVMHFHAVHIKPEWAKSKKPVARIGRHVFYK